MSSRVTFDEFRASIESRNAEWDQCCMPLHYCVLKNRCKSLSPPDLPAQLEAANDTRGAVQCCGMCFLSLHLEANRATGAVGLGEALLDVSFDMETFYAQAPLLAAFPSSVPFVDVEAHLDYSHATETYRFKPTALPEQTSGWDPEACPDCGQGQGIPDGERCLTCLAADPAMSDVTERVQEMQTDNTLDMLMSIGTHPSFTGWDDIASQPLLECDAILDNHRLFADRVFDRAIATLASSDNRVCFTKPAPDLSATALFNELQRSKTNGPIPIENMTMSRTHNPKTGMKKSVKETLEEAIASRIYTPRWTVDQVFKSGLPNLGTSMDQEYVMACYTHWSPHEYLRTRQPPPLMHGPFPNGQGNGSTVTVHALAHHYAVSVLGPLYVQRHNQLHLRTFVEAVTPDQLVEHVGNAIGMLPALRHFAREMSTTYFCTTYRDVLPMFRPKETFKKHTKRTPKGPPIIVVPKGTEEEERYYDSDKPAIRTAEELGYPGAPVTPRVGCVHPAVFGRMLFWTLMQHAPTVAAMMGLTKDIVLDAVEEYTTMALLNLPVEKMKLVEPRLEALGLFQPYHQLIRGSYQIEVPGTRCELWYCPRCDQDSACSKFELREGKVFHTICQKTIPEGEGGIRRVHSYVVQMQSSGKSRCISCRKTNAIWQRSKKANGRSNEGKKKRTQVVEYGALLCKSCMPKRKHEVQSGQVGYAHDRCNSRKCVFSRGVYQRKDGAMDSRHGSDVIVHQLIGGHHMYAHAEGHMTATPMDVMMESHDEFWERIDAMEGVQPKSDVVKPQDYLARFFEGKALPPSADGKNTTHLNNMTTHGDPMCLQCMERFGIPVTAINPSTPSTVGYTYDRITVPVPPKKMCTAAQQPLSRGKVMRVLKKRAATAKAVEKKRKIKRKKRDTDSLNRHTAEAAAATASQTRTLSTETGHTQADRFRSYFTVN